MPTIILIGDSDTGHEHHGQYTLKSHYYSQFPIE